LVHLKICILDCDSAIKLNQSWQTMRSKYNTNITSEDAILVKEAINGNEQAYARLMIRHKNSVYRMIFNIVRNKDDAEDLTLEAFGKAFANLHLYLPEYAFSTWIYKIAINHSIDFLRGKMGKYRSINQYQNPQQEEDKNMVFISNNPNPEEKMIIKQRAVMLRRFIEKLKPHYRKLIEMRYFKEMSYEEMAKELDLPLGTLKVQLFRARNTLYKHVRQTDVND
jgi:RNA polymerase sigma factor (sigma-70 family)